MKHLTTYQLFESASFEEEANDCLLSLKDKGYKIITNRYNHIWVELDNGIATEDLINEVIDDLKLLIGHITSEFGNELSNISFYNSLGNNMLRMYYSLDEIENLLTSDDIYGLTMPVNTISIVFK